MPLRLLINQTYLATFNLDKDMETVYADIRDFESLNNCFKNFDP